MAQADQILAWAKSKLGSTKFDGYCQSFVRQAYEAAGIKTSKGAENATAAWEMWGKSTSSTGIPKAAAVYFNGSNPNKGHVGIYEGNGMVIHAAATVREKKLSEMTGYRGWGYQAGVRPTGSATEAEADDASPSAKKKSATASSSSTETRREETVQKTALTATKTVHVTGLPGAQKTYASLASTGTPYELLIRNRNQELFQPMILDGVVWETTRQGSPSTLTFTVVKDSALAFWEGDTVIFKVEGTGVFYGYVFSKRRDKEQHIEVLAYDQLRYFKNRHTYIYSGKTPDQLLQMIAEDFALQCGELASVPYTIASRIEDNQTLFDILQNALDEALLNTGDSWQLWDDFGFLRLSKIGDRVTNHLLDTSAAQNFQYSSSIEESYNKIQIYDDTDDGIREFTIAQDETNLTRWGVLQWTQKLNDGENAQAKAEAMLRTYNRTGRTLTIENAFGNVEVRAGVLVPVILDIGDLVAQTFMLVEKATHTFGSGEHWMTLSVSGNRDFGV